MSILDTFKAKVHAFLDTISHELQDFAQYFLPKVEAIVEVALEDLAHIASEAVLSQAPKLISGEVKFGNAVSQVIDTVEAQGKTVLQQTAGAAVQLAYLEIQKILTK